MTATGACVVSVRYGTRSLVWRSASGGVTTPLSCESPDARPWPGKCLSTGSTPASRSPWAYAPANSTTCAGSEPNERSPITSSSDSVVTSTTGAKSIVTPRPRMAWPRWNAMPRTSSGVIVCASTRGDGWLPIRSARRDTRPPSSSTLTASGNGFAEAAMSASGAPIIDRSVQLPIMMPPTCWLATTARASSAPVTPTISSWASLSRVDIAASTSPQAGGTGAAGSGRSDRGVRRAGFCFGLLGGGRAGHQQAGQRRERTQ